MITKTLIRICDLRPKDKFAYHGRNYIVMNIGERIVYSITGTKYNEESIGKKSKEYCFLIQEIKEPAIPHHPPPLANYSNNGHIQLINKYSS